MVLFARYSIHTVFVNSEQTNENEYIKENIETSTKNATEEIIQEI